MPGKLHALDGDTVHGPDEISLAQQRTNHFCRGIHWDSRITAQISILDPAQIRSAWVLAQQNLANRETGRAYALAIKAAEATGRYQEACDLLLKAQSQSNKYKSKQISLLKKPAR
jgi:hypothetical protein